MGGNPFKKLHQTLLAKEKSRKDGFRKLANRLMFWKKDESKKTKQDEESLAVEDVQSLQGKRQVSISLRIIRIAYDESKHAILKCQSKRIHIFQRIFAKRQQAN